LDRELCGELGPAVPVVAMGGIASAEDAIEFLAAGATAVQVGSATFVRPPVMLEVVEGIAGYMAGRGMAEVGEISIRS